MAAQLGISPRLAEVITTAILTSWSESAVSAGVPEEVGIELGGLSITETGQCARIAARGRDLGEFATLLGLADADPAVSLATKVAVRRARAACKTLTSESGDASFPKPTVLKLRNNKRGQKDDKHNGPESDDEVGPILRRDALGEFRRSDFISPSGNTHFPLFGADASPTVGQDVCPIGQTP